MMGEGKDNMAGLEGEDPTRPVPGRGTEDREKPRVQVPIPFGVCDMNWTGYTDERDSFASSGEWKYQLCW